MNARHRLLMRLHREEGFALITTVMVGFVVLGLFGLLLANVEHTENASVRGRNFESSLGVAEAGIQNIIELINATGDLTTQTLPAVTNEHGTYTVTVTRCGVTPTPTPCTEAKLTGKGYVIDSHGESGNEARLGRERKVRVVLSPPRSFQYALFSDTSIETKNNDEVEGDVWANVNVTIDANDTVHGTVTAAQGWIDMDTNSTIDEDAWSGGFNGVDPSNVWSIRMASGARILGTAKSSVADGICGPANPDNYTVGGNGAHIGTAGSPPTGGVITFAGPPGSEPALEAGTTVNGTSQTSTCTAAPTTRPLPTFTWDPDNYDPATFHEFSSVAAFQTYISTPAIRDNLVGTFNVQDSLPSQGNRLDLTGVEIGGDVTIYTNAPIFANGIDEASGSGTTERTFVIVSTYAPGTASSCDVNDDNSDCAVHLKNNFDPSCITAALVYAPNGPVAIKNSGNNETRCGSVFADSILVKNNQTLQYTDRIERIIGFGEVRYEVSRWEERPAT